MSKADFKVIVIGPPDAGKTALMDRFVRNQFNASGQNTSTLGVSFVLKRWNGINLAIWVLHQATSMQILNAQDTAGQEHFAPLNQFYARDASAAIIAYDLTSRENFDNIDKWFSYLDSNANDVHKIVVGCKYDLIEDDIMPRAVSETEGHELARRYAAKKYIETSAKTGRNVIDVFNCLCEHLRPGSVSSPPSSPTVSPTISLKDMASRKSPEQQPEKCC
eukprot:gene1350-4526_t